ncbi:hypothetical protein K7X08_023105 [Anisodus acutangulus]|uniref:Uncharacterized protein n=1 Tax=Anisodus acutangulus TaxID=402998 RepID=A0A9Q1MEY6_9SOLA|nr:hypothetical protein K7X08_023105 [Anisodus acutangulus]
MADTNFPELKIAWLQSMSRCLWEDASIIVLLGFLGILLLDSLLCKYRKKSMTVEKYAVGTKVGISYIVSIICTAVLLITHLIMLLMLEKRNGAHCQFKFPILSSEILQMTSCAASFLVLYRTRNRKYIKFPWVLRILWISSFFLSLARATLDAHFVITSDEHLGLADYVDNLGLIASACLLGIYIRGKTGIILDISDSTTEPLLNGNNEKHSEAKRDSPYGKASLLQLITFSWLNPLFEVGVKKPLDQDEVPDVDFRDSAKFLSDSFDKSLKYVAEKDGTTNPSIYTAIYVFARKRATINALYAVISAA